MSKYCFFPCFYDIVHYFFFIIGFCFPFFDGDYAIVGSVGEDPGGVANAGSAYIFHWDGEDWTQQAKITASDAQANDGFGSAVSINGDYIILTAVPKAIISAAPCIV